MTTPTALDDNPRVIDVWSVGKRLWQQKWVWLSVFILVFIGGLAFAITRPPVYATSQIVIVSLPPINSTAEAIQQSGTLTESSATLARAMLRPPITDPVLAAHSEIPSLEALRAQVSAEPLGNTIEIVARGNDPTLTAQLASEVAASFAEYLPDLIEANPPSLQYEVTVWGEPLTLTLSSGRAFLALASVALAGLVATIVAVIRGSRRA